MTEAGETPRFAVPWAGLLAGPLAWAVSTQLNYTLVPWQCANRIFPVPWVALALAALALAGALLSWLAWRNVARYEPGFPRTAETARFVAGVAILAGLLFALVILLQGFAGLVFDGCER